MGLQKTRVSFSFSFVDLGSMSRSTLDQASFNVICEKRLKHGVTYDTVQLCIPCRCKLCSIWKECIYFACVSGELTSEVWFLDRAMGWHYLADSFTDYFRLMVMHLGLPHWQYAFTDIGIPPQAKVGNGTTRLYVHVALPHWHCAFINGIFPQSKALKAKLPLDSFVHVALPHWLYAFTNGIFP